MFTTSFLSLMLKHCRRLQNYFRSSLKPKCSEQQQKKLQHAARCQTPRELPRMPCSRQGSYERSVGGSCKDCSLRGYAESLFWFRALDALHNASELGTRACCFGIVDSLAQWSPAAYRYADTQLQNTEGADKNNLITNCWGCKTFCECHFSECV